MFIFGIIQGFLAKEKRYRLAAIGAVASVVLIVFGFYLFKNTDFVKGSQTLSRFSEISFKEKGTQSRVMLVQMGWQAFKERPIFGWGPENFNLVFSKYYDARLWSQEPWFDRSHNIIFDWLIHGGILGLLSYLSLYGASLYVLWKKYGRDKFQENLMTYLNDHTQPLVFMFLGAHEQ